MTIKYLYRCAKIHKKDCKECCSDTYIKPIPYRLSITHVHFTVYNPDYIPRCPDDKKFHEAWKAGFYD